MWTVLTLELTWILIWMACAVCVTAVLQEEADEDSDLSDYGDETDGKRDALAEPCFMLIGEIFELRGSEQYAVVFFNQCCIG